MWKEFIRPVTKTDAAQLLDIYSYYVKNCKVCRQES